MSHERRILVTESDFERLRRLRGHPHLDAELDHAVIVDSRGVPADVVTMQSRVRFMDETNGTRREVTIVYPTEADATRGRISVLAPVGTALLGLAEGQSIVWPFPDGTRHTLRVLKIVYQPEADDERMPREPRVRRAARTAS
jgi:regulator of nucleoside diphosphate kinase